MGKYAKEFFSRSDFEFIEYPKTYFRLLTLDEVKKWLIRDKWTISEAAALFCGFNPLNFDPDPWMTFTPDEQERKDKYDWMYEYLQKKVCPIPKSGGHNMCFVHLFGAGARLQRETSGEYDYGNARFPLYAYYVAATTFARNEDLGIDIPALGIFHDIEAEEESAISAARFSSQYEQTIPEIAGLLFKQGIRKPLGWPVSELEELRLNEEGELVEQDFQLVAEPAEIVPNYEEWFETVGSAPVALDDVDTFERIEVFELPLAMAKRASECQPTEESIEVVSGISIGDLRRMLVDSSSNYCPRLLAAIQTKKELIPSEASRLDPEHEKAYQGEAEKIATDKLKALGVGNPKYGQPTPSGEPHKKIATQDIKAISRVLVRTHEMSDGRPKKY